MSQRANQRAAPRSFISNTFFAKGFKKVSWQDKALKKGGLAKCLVASAHLAGGLGGGNPPAKPPISDSPRPTR